MPPTPEPFSQILIDKALEASGWNLLDPRQAHRREVGERVQALLHRAFAGYYKAG